MNVIFLGDSHFGYRIDNDAYTNHVRRFYEEEFFPYLIENDIKEVIQFGDLMDNRKYISVKTLYFIKEVFLDPLRDAGAVLHTFLGNHDIVFKNTNKYNSPSHVLESYDNVRLYQDFTNVEIDGTSFGIVPWINKENLDDYNRWIKLTKSDIILGHFEFNGFEYAKGIKAEHGMDAGELKDFKAVYSGHYHTASSKGNIHYIGTPYEMTFADMDDEKGFWVFDTQKKETTRVKSKLKLFKKINYDDTKVNYDDFDFNEFKECYVKAYVINRSDIPMYNRFIDNLYSADAVDINVIEHDIDYDDDLEEADPETKTTIQIINETVNGTPEINTDNVLYIMSDLYKEATLTSGE